MSAYSFYDDLRVNETENFQPIFIGNHVGRNLHRYGSGEEQQDGGSASAGDEDFSLVMCHVPVFMRYTLMHGDGNLTDTSDVGYGASAAALMAIEHWNSGNGVVVKEIEGMTQSCKVRFTTEIFDTQVCCMLLSWITMIHNLCSLIHDVINFSLRVFSNSRLGQFLL